MHFSSIAKHRQAALRRLPLASPPVPRAASSLVNRGVKSLASHENFIFRLQLYRFRLSLYIFRLKLCIFKLKIDFSRRVVHFLSDGVQLRVHRWHDRMPCDMKKQGRKQAHCLSALLQECGGVRVYSTGFSLSPSTYWSRISSLPSKTA